MLKKEKEKEKKEREGEREREKAGTTITQHYVSFSQYENENVLCHLESRN